MLIDEKIYSSQSLHIDNSQVNTNINSDFKYESSDCWLEESLVSCKHFDEDLIPEITPSNSTFHNKDLSNYTIKGISLIIDEDLLDISINPLCITSYSILSIIRFVLNQFPECKYLYIKICNLDSTILSTNSTELINIDNDSESYEQSLGSSITFKSIFSFKEITEQNIKEITIEDDAEGEADQFIKDVVKEFQITEVIFNKWSAETINQLIVENSLNRITFLRVEKPKGTALQVVDIVMNSRENGIVSWVLIGFRNAFHCIVEEM